jgi:hypothetical protein
MHGQFATRLPGCKNSEKYDSTRVEGVQFQNEHAPFKVWVFHHEDVALGSNLEMTPEGGSSFTSAVQGL